MICNLIEMKFEGCGLNCKVMIKNQVSHIKLNWPRRLKKQSGAEQWFVIKYIIIFCESFKKFRSEDHAMIKKI